MKKLDIQNCLVEDSTGIEDSWHIVDMEEDDEADNQLWFWDENLLRNKKYPGKILRIDDHYGEENVHYRLWLKRMISKEHRKSQKWEVEIVNDELVCKFLRERTLRVDASVCSIGTHYSHSVTSEYAEKFHNRDHDCGIETNEYYKFSHRRNSVLGVTRRNGMQTQKWKFEPGMY